MSDQNFKQIKAPKRTPRPAPAVSREPPSPVQIKAARKALQRVLLAMRWDNQGGYVSYDGNGKWAFVSTGLGLTPDELNALFAFAGIVPDEIEIVGDCADCANSDNGHERGYSPPCVSCLRPSHINNFVPIEKLKAHR